MHFFSSVITNMHIIFSRFYRNSGIINRNTPYVSVLVGICSIKQSI